MTEPDAKPTSDRPGARATQIPAELLGEMRNAALKFCQGEVNALTTRIGQSLLRESERSKDAAAKDRLMEVYRTLLGREADFEAALLRHWPAEIDRAIRSDAPPPLLEEFAQTRSQLAIVEEHDVKREIQVLQLIRELESLCSETSSALTLRVCHLRRLDIVEVRYNPFRPETFAIGLIAAWEAFQGGRELTHWLLKGFKAAEFLPLNALYAAMNKILVARGVMPKERFIMRKNAPSATPAALWVKSDIMGTAQASEPSGSGAQAFSAARFLQQLTELNERLTNALPAGLPQAAAGSTGSSAAPDGASRVSITQPGAALLAAINLLLAQQALGAQGQARSPESGDGTAAVPLGMLGAQQIRALKDVTDDGQPDGTDPVTEINRSTIEMVSRIFDFILDDQSMPVPLKAAISDLQLPVLKAALTDPAFFLSESHPARRVVDLLAQCGVFWEILPGDEVADTVRREVERIREASREGADGFAEVAGFLESFIAGLESRYEARLQDSLKNVTAQERRAEVMPEVDRSLEVWFSGDPIEPTLARFLRGPWRQVLCEYVVERASAPEACEAAFANTSLLIWSILPKPTPTERADLIRQLPTLLSALNAGLDKIQAPTEEREPFLKFLMEQHAQAIRPGPGPAPESARAQAGRTVPLPKVEAQAEPVASVERWNAMQLSAGDWFQLDLENHSTRRYRLSWISPKRTKFVFTARESSEALALDEAEVEARLRSGSLRLVDHAPIVQRAIAASFDAKE